MSSSRGKGKGIMTTALQIIEKEVTRYRSEGGWEGDLLRCVDRLSELGKECLVDVDSFIALDSPEVEYFLPLIASNGWLALQEITNRMTRLMASRNAGVRRYAAEWLLDHPDAYREWIEK